MLQITRCVVLGLAFLCSTCISTGTEVTRDVSEIQGLQSVRLAWRSERTKPTVVKTAEDLIKIMPNRADLATVQKQVDFEKQQLLIFVWEGDAQDRIKVNNGRSKVEFVHWGNAAGRDPHLHCIVFAMQQGVAHSVTIEPDPR